MKRGLRVVLVCALFWAWSGCASSKKTVPVVGVENSRIAQNLSDKGQKIRGYTTIDGRYHEFDGRVWMLKGDTLEFYSKAWPRARRTEYFPHPERFQHFRMSRDSVQTLEIVYKTTGDKVITALGVTVLVVGLAIGIVIATKESCPFLYSYDGHHYIFDGEPYGGATMKALERTDWSELEHLAPVHGEYRMLVSNEVDETQHTNSLALLVVDHPPGTTVVMDREGRPHAFRELISLRAAHDESGHDLTGWLRDKDEVVWYPDLKYYSGLDSLSDGRNHITLEFPRPKGVDHAYLVTDVATGQWGSHMIRTMLRMRGRGVDAFYAAINGSDLIRKQLLDWNAREELFEMFPEIQCGSTWVRQGLIPAGGPFISETRAIPIDLSRVEGNVVRIRIHPPIGFWSLNAFHLAAEESPAQVTEVQARTAGRWKNGDALAALRADDDRYLDFPGTGDRVDLAFPAPQARAGMIRSIFARTRGWYEVHLHDLGEPDQPGLARLTDEPGYAVRRSLREYADYRRTGALLGVKDAANRKEP